MKRQLQAKFRGALLGGAIGDAVGAPFEGGWPLAQLPPTRLEREDSALRYTDDTHMTLGMAESLVACRGFDGAHMATVFARNYTAEPWRGYGAGPPQVFRLIEQGIPWNRASSMLFGGAGSFGNGAAMRVAPVALVAFKDKQRVAWLARQTGRITHSHALGLEGAVLQATAIATLIQQPADAPLDPGTLLSELRSCVHTPVYHEKLTRIEALLPDAPADQVITHLGTGIAAHESVPTALYVFLRSPASFSTAVTYAIGLGGDTDTIAAMTGTLVGAYQGEESIPASARERVGDGARLRELADALLALAVGEVPVRPEQDAPDSASVREHEKA